MNEDRTRLELRMLSPFLSTFLRVRTSSKLAVLLDRVRPHISNRVLLYSIGTTSSADAQDIENVVNQLSKSSRTSVGCLTSQIALQPSTQGRREEGSFSLALEAFDEESCVVFNSSEVDRDTVQVGRWHTTARRDAPLDMDLPWTSTSGEIGGNSEGDYWEKARNQRIQADSPKDLGALTSG